MIRSPFHALLLLSCLSLISACQSAVLIGAQEASMAAVETRTFGEVVDDSAIYAEINHYFIQTDVNDLLMNVSVTVREGRVLLTGMVKSPDTPGKAVDAAWRTDGVQEVINEIEIYPHSNFAIRTRDEVIEKQVEGKLTITKGVNVLNYSIEVVNGKVYLLGTVANQRELDNVFAVTRRLKGVKEVVSHLRHAEPKEIVDPAIAPTANYPATPYRR